MRFVALLTVILTLVACKGGGGGGGGSGEAVAVPDPGMANEYIGFWLGCKDDTSDNTSTLTTYSISDYSLIITALNYSGLNCQTANVQYEERFVHQVEKSNDKYNTTLIGASTRPLSVADVNWNNTNTYCGIAGWSLNEPQNILNRTCAGALYSWGEEHELAFSKSGNNLTINVTNGATVSLTAAETPNFDHNGTAITNGTYVLIEETIAYFVTFNNGSYSLVAHDIDSSKYYTQSGTYSVSGSIIALSMTSESPACNGMSVDLTNLQYSPGTMSVIFKNNGDELITSESFDWSSAEFLDAFAGLAPPTSGCI